MSTTLAELVALDILHSESVRCLSLARTEAFEQILAGAKAPKENDVTQFIALLDGNVERAVIELFCEVSGVTYTSRLRLENGSDFRADSGQVDTRAMDLVVYQRKEGSTEVVPVIAIEAKFGAYVNARWGYCPRDPEAYSNQVICYVHGCLNPLLDEKVKFVWLGLVTAGSPWGNKGINERDLIGWPLLASAYEAQQGAEEKWHSVVWPQLYERVAVLIKDVDIRRSVLQALGAGPADN